MKIIASLLFGLCFYLAAFPAMAQTGNDPAVARAEAWLSSLDQAQASFRQIDYQGRELRGTFYLDRPGRLRFEYDAPIEDHIVADGTFIYFHDGASGQANSAPIGATLADFILRPDVRMDRSVTVKSVRERDGMTMITLAQADQPGMGELILNFNQNPFRLGGWRIIDAQGLTTDIVLSDFREVSRLDPRLFVYQPAQAQDRFNQ